MSVLGSPILLVRITLPSLTTFHLELKLSSGATAWRAGTWRRYQDVCSKRYLEVNEDFCWLHRCPLAVAYMQAKQLLFLLRSYFYSEYQQLSFYHVLLPLELHCWTTISRPTITWKRSFKIQLKGHRHYLRVDLDPTGLCSCDQYLNPLGAVCREDKQVISIRIW